MYWCDCNHCNHLSITEDEQTDVRVPHICKFYDKQVIHRASTRIHDPYLWPCNQCVKDGHRNFETRKSVMP